MRLNPKKLWLAYLPHYLTLLLVCLMSGFAYATSYDYDELGRLITVTENTGQLTVYRYDESGNLLAVEAIDPADLNIIDFTPKAGSVGTTVNIVGTGFSPVLADNDVYINGTSAQVLTASTTSLSIVIPAGATSGLIQVDTPMDTAYSSDPLSVEADSGLPVIISVSSDCIAAGQTLTIDGFYLGDQATTRVEIGHFLATTTVESNQRLSVVAPASSMGGKIKVVTSIGSVESEQAVAIMTSSSLCNSFDSSRWIDIDAPLVHPGVPSGKKAYWFFRGESDQWLSLQVSGTNADAGSLWVPLKLHRPDKTQVYTGTLYYANYTGAFQRLTEPGVYRIEIGSGLGFDGILETPTALSLDGSAVTVNTARSQAKRIAVPLGSGQGFSLAPESLTIQGGSSATIQLRDPAGSLVPALDGSDNTCSGSGSTTACGVSYQAIDPGNAPIFNWSPNYPATNSTAELLLSSIQTQPLSDNQPESLDIQRAGQTINYTFQGNADNGVSISLNSLDVIGTENRVQLYLSAPGGEIVNPVDGSSNPVITEPGGFVTYQNLPATGEYTLRLVPFAGHLATGSITLNPGQPISATPLTVSATSSGSHARLTIDALAGESYGIGFTQLDIQAPSSSQRSFTAKLYTPDGQLMPLLNSTQTQTTCSITNQPGCDIDFIPMPYAGQYALIIEPNNAVTSYSFDVQATLDVTQAVEYTPFSYSIIEPGQNARLSFAGQPGQAKRVVLSNVMPDPTGKQLEGYVLMPDGTVLGTAPLLSSKFRDIVPDKIVSIGDFPIPGNYTLYLDPDYASTADFTVRQDDGVIDGMNLVPAIAGPWRTVEFNAVAGEQWSFALHNVDLATSPFVNPKVTLVMYDPDNLRVIDAAGTNTSSSCTQLSGSWDCDLDLPPLSKTGTYHGVAYIPVERGSDIVTADAIALLDLVIADTVADMQLAQGQNGYLEFPVTSGTSLPILVTRNSGIDAGNPLTIRVKDPNGETINFRNMSATTSVTAFSVSSSSTSISGTYRIEIDPDRGRTAAVNVSVE